MREGEVAGSGPAIKCNGKFGSGGAYSAAFWNGICFHCSLIV